MDLTKFKFKEVTEIDIALSTMKTDKALLEEARIRGFYGGNTLYNRLFSQIFFSGGTVKFKDKVDPEFKSKAWSYCRSLMSSFEPKHEEKEAICAMLLSELVEPKLEDKA